MWDDWESNPDRVTCTSPIPKLESTHASILEDVGLFGRRRRETISAELSNKFKRLFKFGNVFRNM